MKHYLFVAIPFFKNTEFLSETLQSLKSQSDPHWKAVVLDDSIENRETHAAQEMVAQLNDPRIAYYRNPENIGMARNWNQGLDMASEYELVSLLHADDRLLPDFVAQVKAASQLYPDAAAFFCKTEIINEHGKKSFSFADFYKNFLLPKTEGGYLLLNGVRSIAQVIPGNFIFCPTMVYRTSKLGGLRFDPQYRMVLDFDLTLKLLEKGQQLVGLYEKPLFQYRRHKLNATSELTQSLVRFHEEVMLYDKLAQLLDAKGECGLSKAAKQKKIIKKNLCFLTLKSALLFDFASCSKYAKFLSKL